MAKPPQNGNLRNAAVPFSIYLKNCYKNSYNANNRDQKCISSHYGHKSFTPFSNNLSYRPGENNNKFVFLYNKNNLFCTYNSRKGNITFSKMTNNKNVKPFFLQDSRQWYYAMNNFTAKFTIELAPKNAGRRII